MYQHVFRHTYYNYYNCVVAFVHYTEVYRRHWMNARDSRGGGWWREGAVTIGDHWWPDGENDNGRPYLTTQGGRKVAGLCGVCLRALGRVREMNCPYRPWIQHINDDKKTDQLPYKRQFDWQVGRIEILYVDSVIYIIRLVRLTTSS